MNTMTCRLIDVLAADGVSVSMSLPETYAALMRDEVESFPALRPHQRHAWHAFTVQLGAMALHRAGLVAPPTDAETWREIIRGLTPDFPDDEPWRLVVDDITKPAFMQPPASSEKKMADYKSVVGTPDELDMLVTSKNHDLKSSVADSGGAGDWLFALVALQTMEGYSAAGKGQQYHSISKVRSSNASRSAFSLTPSVRFGAHAKRDIGALLDARIDLEDLYGMSEHGIGLLWIPKWDGASSEALQPDQLHPFHIEICRRVRLSWDKSGGLRAGRLGTKSARVNAKNLRGNIGDAWLPIRIGGKQIEALSLRKGGFTYRQIVDCLDPAQYDLPPIFITQSERTPSQPMFLVARGVIRYPQGAKATTEGYHERAIPLRLKAIQVFGRVAEAQTLGDIARERVGLVTQVQNALRDALAEFVHQGKDIYQLDPRKLRELRYRADVGFWVNRLDEVVDVSFFEDLQSEFDADNADERERVRSDWLLNDADGNGLTNHAHHILSEAMEELPCSMMQRYRAQVNASRVFRYGLRKNHLPTPFTDEKPTDEEKSECPNSEPT